MTTVAKAAVVLFVVGWPAARLVMPRAVAVLFAPAVAALVCTGAASAALVTRTSLEPWLFAAIAAGWLGVALRWSRARAERWPAVDLLSVVLIATATLPPLRALRLGPMEWDARSIWWLHAKWFWAGGTHATDAFGNAAYAFSHPDYPPVSSATVAAGWTLTGGTDLWLAQAIMALLTYAGVVAAAVAIVGLLRGATDEHTGARRRLLWLAGIAIGSGFALAAFALSGKLALRGYADLLWSGWFAAAAVFLLLHPVDRRSVAAGTVALSVTMLTKNEGMLAGFVLIGLGCLRYRRELRLVLPLAAPAIAAAAWVAITRSLGAESDLAITDGLARLLRGDDAVLDRAGPTLDAMRPLIGWPAAIGAGVVAVGLLLLRKERRATGVGSGLWLPVLTVAVLGLALLAYVISPRELWWHLITSVDRVMIAPRVLIAAEIAVCAAVAARTLIGGPVPRDAHPPRGPDGDDVALEAGSCRRAPAGGTLVEVPDAT